MQTASQNLDRYDAGLLAGEGMPNFEWWWDSIRFHLDRAHEFYQSQVADSDRLRERVRELTAERNLLLDIVRDSNSALPLTAPQETGDD